MAKANGSPLNPWRGRVGGMVYSQDGSRTIVRSYNPNVANPRTSPQLMQRAKVTLAGKLSAITPADAILGMGKSTRERRSEFVKNIIANSDVTLANGTYRALLPAGDLKFSVGSPVSRMAVVTTPISSGSFTATVSLTEEAPAAMVVVVVYSGSVGQFSLVQTAIVDADNNVASFNIGERILGDIANLYVVPLYPKTTTSNAVTDGVLKGDSVDYLGTYSQRPADMFEHRESQFISTLEYSE